MALDIRDLSIQSAPPLAARQRGAPSGLLRVCYNSFAVRTTTSHARAVARAFRDGGQGGKRPCAMQTLHDEKTRVRIRTRFAIPERVNSPFRDEGVSEGEFRFAHEGRLRSYPCFNSSCSTKPKNFRRSLRLIRPDRDAVSIWRSGNLGDPSNDLSRGSLPGIFRA